jgi:hypothetical protein
MSYTCDNLWDETHRVVFTVFLYWPRRRPGPITHDCQSNNLDNKVVCAPVYGHIEVVSGRTDRLHVFVILGESWWMTLIHVCELMKRLYVIFFIENIWKPNFRHLQSYQIKANNVLTFSYINTFKQWVLLTKHVLSRTTTAYCIHHNISFIACGPSLYGTWLFEISVSQISQYMPIATSLPFHQT